MGKKTETEVNITFRSMAAADVDAVVRLEAETFSDAWKENMLLDEINNSMTDYFVMEKDGVVIGYAGFWLVAGEAQITRVAVQRTERGEGYGTKLVAALIRRARGLGAKAITLEVRKSNIAAQKVYLTCGFKIMGERPGYYKNTNEAAVIMWLL
ncbi:MAG: ribosomal protein S18-alanine N-acetyltransferase [Phascolarctobacterium sp.]|nr:ribosomal protein S18-alanine N-acetyltransferase [Phascolarctobacterium sp.]